MANTTTRLAGEAQRRGRRGGSLRGALFRRIFNRIHRYFVKLIWDPHGVEDCLQETLLLIERALQSGEYDPRRSFNRWMWLKAHRVYVEYCRKHARRPTMRPLPPEMGETTGGALDRVEGRLDRPVVLAKLREMLPAESFETLVLHYDQDLSVTEIAGVLERDRKTVVRRLAQAQRCALRLIGSEA